MLKAALNMVTRIHSRAATLKRYGTPDVTSACRITPSNYFRNQRGPEYISIEGYEFIIPIDSIVNIALKTPKKGDQITDGTQRYTISEIIEMYDLGASVMAYRVRCD